MRRTRALLIVGAIVLGCFLLGALAVPLLSREDTATRAYPGASVSRVEVVTDRGGVVVRAGTPEVVQRRKYILSKPDVEQSVSAAGVLRVEVTCPAWAFASCSADVDVRAPADAEVFVDATRGTVHVEGMRGPVVARSEDGAVSVAGDSTRVEARSVSEPVRVALGRPPASLTAASETGNVTVEVPAVSYRIAARSLRGATRVEGLESDPSAARQIVARSGIGDVVVRAAD